MSGIDLRKFARASTMERWPWAVRALLGCCAGIVAEFLTYSIKPLQAFPLLLAFATVILVCWYLGMWGGVLCALTDAVLIDRFLTGTQVQLTTGFVREEIRLTVFLLISILLGWAIRQLAQQRSQLATQELRQRLAIANAERELAEEHARATEELRDRDEVLQIALQANGMGLWVWDSQQDIVQWSDEVYRIAGREPGSAEPSTEAWLSFVHPEDLEAVKTSVMQARVAAKYHQQHRILWPDGTVRWVESQGKSQRDTEGNVTRVAGVLADITSRKLSEESMLRAEKLAVAGRLAASVAHEINNPLEAVANLLYLITHAETTESAREQAQQALEELMRIALITQQTLKFHRQAGTPKITTLSEVIQTVLALFRGRLRSSEIEVEVRAVREAKRRVHAGRGASDLRQPHLERHRRHAAGRPADRSPAAFARLAQPRRTGYERSPSSIRASAWTAQPCSISSSLSSPPKSKPEPGSACGWSPSWRNGITDMCAPGALK